MGRPGRPHVAKIPATHTGGGGCVQMMSGPTRCSVCRWARTVSGFVCGEGQIRHLQDILLFLEAIAERCVKITFQYRLGDTGSISFKYFVYYYLKFLSNFYDCSGVQSFLSIVF